MGLKIESVVDEWVSHVKNRFPRELFTWREVVNSDVLFVKRIRENFSRFDVFTSVYPTDLREHTIIDTLFFDLDADDLEKGHRQMGVLVRHSINRLDYEPRVYFSGKKGFHFHFDFEPLKLKVDFRKLAKKFIKFLHIPNVPLDTHVSGDIQRIDRVPFTIHTGSRRLCIPIDPKWSLGKIKSESKKCNIEKRVEIIENGEVRKIVDEFNDPEIYLNESVAPTQNQVDFESSHIRPHILEGMKTEHPLHYIRLAFVPEAFYNGWTEEEIINAFRHVDDFDEEQTAYFVRKSIEKIKNGLKPWKNETLEKYAVKNNSNSKIFKGRS
ncbi:MAG: hypothetical protein ACTSPB_02295 [Candidatus Thorarchaeota archaeon]